MRTATCGLALRVDEADGNLAAAALHHGVGRDRLRDVLQEHLLEAFDRAGAFGAVRAHARVVRQHRRLRVQGDAGDMAQVLRDLEREHAWA